MALSQYWQWFTEILVGLGGEKTKPIQSQSISVQSSAFSGQRQDDEKEFEKTKPI